MQRCGRQVVNPLLATYDEDRCSDRFAVDLPVAHLKRSGQDAALTQADVLICMCPSPVEPLSVLRECLFTITPMGLSQSTGYWNGFKGKQTIANRLESLIVRSSPICANPLSTQPPKGGSPALFRRLQGGSRSARG